MPVQCWCHRPSVMGGLGNARIVPGAASKAIALGTRIAWDEHMTMSSSPVERPLRAPGQIESA